MSNFSYKIVKRYVGPWNHFSHYDVFVNEQRVSKAINKETAYKAVIKELKKELESVTYKLKSWEEAYK